MENNNRKPKSSIPPEAKRVFKGVIFDVYQWEQKMYDDSVSIFEKLKRTNTAVIIPILPDGKVLIADQEQPDKEPFTDFPKGRVEENEEPLHAAKRELQEESGYESDEWSFLTAIKPVPKIDWTIYIYIAKNCRKTGEQNLDNGEKISPRTVSFEELMDLIIEDKIHDPYLAVEFLKAKLDPQKMTELKKTFSP